VFEINNSFNADNNLLEENLNSIRKITEDLPDNSKELGEK
jgi:hypothetical protein